MEHKPDNNRKRKKRSGKNWSRSAATLVFTIFTVLVAVFVYRAVNEGVGLPTTGVGEVRMGQNATSAPTETESSTEETTEDPALTETTEEPSSEPQQLSAEQYAQQYMAEMTLEEKIWQMFCLSPSQMYFEDGTLCPAGSVYYSAEDLTDAETLSSELQKFKDDAKTPVMIGASEEGGTNAPLAELGLTDSFDSAATYGEIGNTQAVYDSSNAMGEQLSSAGFHFNLAPVADTINWYPDSLLGRTYGTDIELVSQMVYNAVSGLQDGGTIACLKHFPNLGSSAPEGENDISWQPHSSFAQNDFIPFRAGIDAGVQMILVSNMMVPDMCGGTLMPSCMSENIVTNVLRGELGFNGVVISDEQSRYNDPQTTLELISAGCDIILMPADAQASVAAVIEAVNDGELTESRIDESVYRILLLKCQNGIIEQ